MTVGPSDDTGNPRRAMDVRVLTLNDDDHKESVVFRLNQGWILQFRLGPTLFGQKLCVYTNHPKSSKSVFSRTVYRKLEWVSDSASRDDDTALFSNVPIVLAGSFHYYCTFERDSTTHRASGYFLVDPNLKYGTNDETLPLDCIQCQTYLSKCLGPLDEWENRLLVAKESGYNMIHFTPVQELGGSLSAYSLSDQLSLNSTFSGGRAVKYTMTDVEKLIQKMREQWKVLSVCDIVLNHSANDSPWLRDHPECAYNLHNSPHMRPAYLLDAILWQFAMEIAAGKWESRGIPPSITQEHQLNAIRDVLHGVFLLQVKLHELYLVNVDKLVEEFLRKAQNKNALQGQSYSHGEVLEIIQDPEYRRLASLVDTNLALKIYNVQRGDAYSEQERLQKCSDSFRNRLEELNHERYKALAIHLTAAVENVLAGVRYQRLQADGPKIALVSEKNPLVPRYFTPYDKVDRSLVDEEKIMYSDKAKYLMAHNGWVMGDDPLRDFAALGSNVYIRRELIAWGDSVKLRYGQEPKDCPYLWQHMRLYAEATAKAFHGIRLDNCHSTPIHVAEYILDASRRVRPDLYVVAELFTSNENLDNIFVNRLGINSLIREAMSAHDSHEEGRLVYRYGGVPVGAFAQTSVRPLVPSTAHALFLDLTHDNPSPIEKRSIYDFLPSAALVSMACCATGSNRGYDELVPHHIHVVEEARLYPSWSPTVTDDSNMCHAKSGIIPGKRALNQLHYELGYSGFSEVYVDQVNSDVVAVTRHCPVTHQSVVLVAYTAFTHPHDPNAKYHIPPLCIPGNVDEIIFEAHMVFDDQMHKYEKNVGHINGVPTHRVEVRQHIQLYESDLIERRSGGNNDVQEIDFCNFRPGSVIVFRVSLDSKSKEAVLQIRNCISRFDYRAMSCAEARFEQFSGNDLLPDIISRLTLQDLNRILFRCDQEEQDEGNGFGTYHIPQIGNFTYCGLQGVMSFLAEIHLKNDLGHPLCDNLRQGNWLMEYTSNRLKLHYSTKALGIWFENVFAHVKQIPRYLIPCYYDAIVTGTYSLLLEHAWSIMSKFVSDGSAFVRALALGSVVLGGVVRSAPLPRLSPNLRAPVPVTEINEKTSQPEPLCTTLSAGLPHFSVGYMRNWGRDTFIALRGLFLLTGRHKEARFIILGFGGCLRHGLIPNLLDGGSNSRFNCRDAAWLWLQSVQDYCRMVPDGHQILQDAVLRIFPHDDSAAYDGNVNQPLFEVVYEMLLKHLQGLEFRERNAGYDLDRQMSSEGFNNKIGVDEETGFVFGGNVHNCGTWMDKMGSSEVAGTKGRPATPRDGSAVEIVGLCMSAIRWLSQMHKNGLYPYDGIVISKQGVERKVTFDGWADQIKSNFEKNFWIPTDPKDDGQLQTKLINVRGIYKDTVGATQRWADYQLRCNFPFAMTVAPEMFDPQHAWIALQSMEEHLLGPLGMKTLSENDWEYDGFYDNSNNSSNFKVAHGYNYHQGPEWLWPVGYFLRAKLHFSRVVNGDAGYEETVLLVKKTLSRHFAELQKSGWKGLPELTNKNGEHCAGSCHIQAWSMSCLLEVLYDLNVGV